MGDRNGDDRRSELRRHALDEQRAGMTSLQEQEKKREVQGESSPSDRSPGSEPSSRK